MMGGYRIVHFVPDPFSGARIPIAALVTVAGSLKVVRASYSAVTQPPARAALIDFIASKLQSAKDLSTLPASAGPQAVLGPVGEIPVAVTDPLGWVKKFVLPEGNETTPRQRKTTPLAKTGMRLFEQFSVAHHVREDFIPAHAWPRITGFPVNDLQKVTHWAGSSEGKVVLMEPIDPGRQNVHVVQSRVFARFSAYTNVLKEFNLQAQLFVYLLQGGREEERGSIRRGLGLLRNVETVDTENENDRGHFFHAIRDAGTSRNRQLTTSM